MTKVSAVIFDMDGTLLDSREMIYRAMEDVLAAHDVVLTREELGAVTGKPIKAMYALLAPHLDGDALEAAHLEHHAQNLHLLSLYEGARELLVELKSMGLKLGIFTGFNELTYDRLNQFNITELFDTIVETTRYTAHKPDPEGMFVAMHDINITDPKEIIYVGDGVSDMQAGIAADVLATIGITHGFSTGEVLKASGADQVISSLAELIPIIKSHQ